MKANWASKYYMSMKKAVFTTQTKFIFEWIDLDHLGYEVSYCGGLED